MSRLNPDSTSRDSHRHGEHRGHVCRIPRRNPTTAAAVAAVAGRPTLVSRVIAKSSHDTNATKYRHEGQRSGKINLRSRSEDEERFRALGRAAGLCAAGAAGAGGARRALPPTPPQPPSLPSARSARFDRLSYAGEKKSNVTRKMFKDLIIHVNKPEDVAAQMGKTMARFEEVKTQHHFPRSDCSANSVLLKMADSQSLESMASLGDSIDQLKKKLKEKKADFDTLNSELKTKQKSMMVVLGEMKAAHSRLVALGGDAEELPGAHELVCPGAVHMDGDHDIEGALDSVVLLPNNLVCCCDAALGGQQDIVRWLSFLVTSKDKGIFKQDLIKKVNEFARAHAGLAATLDATKANFTDQFAKAVNIIRRGWSEREMLARETERLSVEVAELTSQNGDLHKQLLSADHPMYTRADKLKIEEMEKELKEERCKRSIVRERLTRSDAQVKAANARVCELEVELEKTRSEVRALETSVRQLQDQNLNIQIQFDGELSKLTESLKKNLMEFQEVADAREELVLAKKNLEIKLEESCKEYNETIKCMKSEINVTISKLLEVETQMKEVVKEKNKVDTKLNAAVSKVRIFEAENNNLLTQLEEKILQLENKDILQNELTKKTKALEKCELEIKDLHRIVEVQEQALSDAEELKQKLSLELKQKKESIMEIKNNLIDELRSKGDLVTELKRKMVELENELQESESKVELYEHQLKSLKSNLGYVPHDEEEASMDCFTELRQLIVEQRTKLLEATRQNGELAAALQEKDGELEQRARELEAHRTALARHDEQRRAHEEREREQARALDRLRHDLDVNTQNELILKEKYTAKSEEVDILATNIDKRKQEIHQLEEILLTLQDHLDKSNATNGIRQETIENLERRVKESALTKRKKVPSDRLEHLMSILEKELRTSDYNDIVAETDYTSGRAQGKTYRNDGGGGRAQKLSTSVERSKLGDSDSSLGEVYHKLIKKMSPSLLKNSERESSCASGSERSTSRDPNRYGTSVDSDGWIRRPRNNINVYHTVRTDIELGGGCGVGARAQGPALAEETGWAAPRELLTRRPLVTLRAPPPRGHRTQRYLDNAAYLSPTFKII